ncbi:VOC family protein (plasmid) [Pantoea sp. JZ29]|uniref:VOC family protein n=1 Tax=Pantoea sp. JZ29 TaxID=2654192 RepID=UPI002B4A7E82|nr:VOC family protein [Pantoea sp. JZ29]WRH23345.1 VOC family protein [Pantoea sp. JZ29]
MRTQKRCMGYVAIVVDDYDRAIEYYTDKLGFALVEDTPQPGKRWVVVTPNPESDCNLLLARASNERQEDFIGNQCGGRVFLFLQTDDFWRDYNAMKAKGVHFCHEPREEDYGMVVVFEDIYGNRWDLYQNVQP